MNKYHFEILPIMKDLLKLLSHYELLHVFCYLNAQDLKSTKLVCKSLFYNEQEIMNIAFRNICLMRWNENEDKILKILGAGDSWEHLHSLLIWKKRVPKGVYTHTKNSTIFGHGRQNGCEGWILITHTPNTRLPQHIASPMSHQQQQQQYYRSIGMKLCLQNTRNDLMCFQLDEISIDLVLLNNNITNNHMINTINNTCSNMNHVLKAQNVQIIARNGVKFSPSSCDGNDCQSISSPLSQPNSYKNSHLSNHRHKIHKSFSSHASHKSSTAKILTGAKDRHDLNTENDTTNSINTYVKLRQYEFIVMSFEFHLPISPPLAVALPLVPLPLPAQLELQQDVENVSQPSHQPFPIPLSFNDIEHESDFLSIAKCIQIKHMIAIRSSSSSSSSSELTSNHYTESNMTQRWNDVALSKEHSFHQSESAAINSAAIESSVVVVVEEVTTHSPTSSSSFQQQQQQQRLLHHPSSKNHHDNLHDSLLSSSTSSSSSSSSSSSPSGPSALHAEEQEKVDCYVECSLECSFLEEDDIWKHYVELPGNVVLLRRDCDANTSSRF